MNRRAFLAALAAAVGVKQLPVPVNPVIAMGSPLTRETNVRTGYYVFVNRWKPRISALHYPNVVLSRKSSEGV